MGDGQTGSHRPERLLAILGAPPCRTSGDTECRYELQARTKRLRRFIAGYSDYSSSSSLVDLGVLSVSEPFWIDVDRYVRSYT